MSSSTATAPADLKGNDSKENAQSQEDTVSELKRIKSQSRRKKRLKPRNSIVMYIDAMRDFQKKEMQYLKKKKDLADIDSKEKIILLPRGGTYVQTCLGPVQCGLPPETIKDAMNLGLTLPTHYILPKQRFNLQMGINVAEFEFPAYFNFFVKRRKINIICTADVEPLVRNIFRETLLGPEEIALPEEYSEAVPEEAYPDLLKESSHFSRNPFNPSEELTVDTLLSFTIFNSDGVAVLEGDDGEIVEIHDDEEEYVICEKDKDMTEIEEVARVSAYVILTSPYKKEAKETKDGMDYFVPPYFGITMLGNSDGFDKQGMTTGFVLWVNRRGIMVDPPPHSGALLRKHGIHARLLKGIILTHCHADHDAGTFQKILEEKRVVLMTTPVILESFLRKYSAISGLETGFLRKLFIFNPITVGHRVGIYGGHLQFFYALHTIPCVGFQAFCGNKSMVYSADTFNDPEGITKIYEKGLMTKERMDALINFPWHHDVILHEAGVPPIHTPISTLEALDDDVKSRLYIVHKPTRDVPTDKGLKSALVGTEHTIIICDKPAPNASAMEILDLVASIDMFNDFHVDRAIEIINCAQQVEFKRGDVLIQEGSVGYTLFVLKMGIVSVTIGGQFIKYLTVGDHFGEMSIVTGERRTATITAVTPVEALQFDKQDFLHIVRQTDAMEKLINLGKMQRSKSWQVIQSNRVFNTFTSSQKTYLQSIFHTRHVKSGDLIWIAKRDATEAVLVSEGRFVFARAQDMQPFTRGAFVGDMQALLNDTPLTTTLVCIQSGELYSIQREALLKFFDSNPGSLVYFMNRRFVE